MIHQCEFEQIPKYPRCEKPATGLLVTKVGFDKPHKARYCNMHYGYVVHQLKGTYVRIKSWVLFDNPSPRVEEP